MTAFRLVGGVVFLLSLTALVEPVRSQPRDDRTQAIADLEKQLADLQQKLGELKKQESKATLPALPLEAATQWNVLREATLSEDGVWFGCALGPSDGETQVVLRQTKGEKQWKLPAGTGSGESLVLAADSRWAAFRHAAPKDSKTGSNATLVDLQTGDKQEWDGMRRVAFSGESAGWLALHRTASAPATGSDLVLRDLTKGTDLVLGNVAEFAFDKQGKRLALLIDAANQGGNGVQLLDLTSGSLASLDTARATYQKLTWTEDGSAFAALRSSADKDYDGKRSAVVAFTDLDAKTPRKVVYDPARDAAFPKDMTISASRPAAWRADRSALTFGIVELKKKKSEEKKAEKPDLVVWHWRDDRLQSQQQVQATTDRAQSYAAIYHVAEAKFVRLADATLRDVTIPPRGSHALGHDRRSYQLQSTLDGKRLSDVVAIDLKTGARKTLLAKNRWLSSVSPDGKLVLYYEDGHYRTCELATGKTTLLTQDVPTAFIDVADDRNVDRPPTPALGWTKDSNAVLLSDRWDVWLVPTSGSGATNLTGNGKKDGLRYRSRYRLDPDEKGIDLSQPQYFSVLAESTKQAGLVRLDKANPTPTRLLWGDAEFGALQKARKAETFVYTRETFKDFPDFYATDAAFQTPCWLTEANPQQMKYAWCAGTQLIEYRGVKNEKLQGLLLLPAGYAPGKTYPTIVYIYERLSDRRNRYLTPTLPGGGFNAALYTSAGYAVLMPDIDYQLNDPGVSAGKCVTAALAAAEKTGVVDPRRVGLHGHSWGGYQTAFLVTQTNAFKAAVAGAPLTNLVSMYSSIYWNTGSANQPIFESSQGRFTSGYWDNQEAFLRNSPVFHASKVQTPLLLLHNDKDGAVDWNQSIEYFNTLRRLGKPVVLLQYKGENHGLAKSPNKRDYALRMREYFDHYLLDKPAPAWLQDGIPHLKHDEQLQERAKQ